MAKETINTVFTNAVIDYNERTKEFIITEYTNHGMKTYNLTEKLKQYVGKEGVSLAITRDVFLNTDISEV